MYFPDEPPTNQPTPDDVRQEWKDALKNVKVHVSDSLTTILHVLDYKDRVICGYFIHSAKFLVELLEDIIYCPVQHYFPAWREKNKGQEMSYHSMKLFDPDNPDNNFLDYQTLDIHDLFNPKTEPKSPDKNIIKEYMQALEDRVHEITRGEV